MAIDTKNLIDGSIYQVDNEARFPLGKKVEDDNGRVFEYVKAGVAMTAGTAVGDTGFTAMGLAAIDGGAKVTSSTPGTAKEGDVVGVMVKVVRAGKTLGVFPVVGASKNGNTIIAAIPQVKTGDTLSLVAYAHGITAAGTGLLPVADIAKDSYGFCLVA